MRELGYEFSWTKLSEALLLEVVDTVFNPKQTLERVARRIARVVREEYGEKYNMPLRQRQADLTKLRE